jgi:hypothetical protein
MQFRCVCLDTGCSFLGTCALPANTIDPIGTEHMFGDVVYVLESITIDGSGGSMYFSKKK